MLPTKSIDMSMVLSKQEQFFYDNAGYSYDPKTETPEQGKVRCAKAMAEAETWATEEGYYYRWEIDLFSDSSDWSDEEPPWSVWACAMYSPDAQVVASLSGIDFGRDKEPWGDSYRRVVEAELALEIMSRRENIND